MNLHTNLDLTELVGLFRRNYDENRGEKRKLPTKFMIYVRIVVYRVTLESGKSTPA